MNYIDSKMNEASTNTSAATSSDDDDPYSYQDPLASTLRENDHFLLHFADNRQIFAQALPRWKAGTKTGFVPCKINKRTYWTHDLIGLPYGTVLEVGNERGLIPLKEGEDLIPNLSMDEVLLQSDAIKQDDAAATAAINEDTKAAATSSNVTRNDNRNLIDDNTSQKLTTSCVEKLVESTKSGSDIVAALISNSSTFTTKTPFSQAKYVKKKQLKYQMRCRIVRITPYTLCQALHNKDSKKISNLRHDTLGQIMSNSNICPGSRALIFDNAVQGIITASCTHRMGGYGSVFCLYEGNGGQPGYVDGVINRMNFTLGEKQSLKWIHVGEVFGRSPVNNKTKVKREGDEDEVVDIEERDRSQILWPAPLQSHTRSYVENELKDERKVTEFLAKRSARFTRKLTRNSMLELRTMIDECCGVEESLDLPLKKDGDDGDNDDKMDISKSSADRSKDITSPQQCDSLIIATKYDPTTVLLRLLPYLAPSCPFVIYHEFLEPLLDTFHTLQNYYVTDNDDNDDDNGDDNGKASKKTPMMQQRNIAINLRLTDTWFREYQVLEGRTHPNMVMTQNGGYILWGTKLCPIHGTNELSEDTIKEIRAKVGGMRKRLRGKTREGKKRKQDVKDNEEMRKKKAKEGE